MIVVGTRPEIIKMAPIIRALEEQSQPYVFVHCGQHYDYEMSRHFIEELELPTPDYEFKVKACSPGQQTGRIIILIERVIKQTKPKGVLVEGDTNSVLASALAAVKLSVKIGHVEAGLRCFDLRMSEEHNRRLVDHVSTYLFAPTDSARKNLLAENVWGQIYVTGNTVIDAVEQHLPKAERRSNILDKIRFKQFALATTHRCENVEDPDVLHNFVDAFVAAPVPVIYPIHPRTRKRLRKQKIWKKLSSSDNVQVFPPLGYFDFLVLMKNCQMILTDSGGLQEEATAPHIRKPVLVIRQSTERTEAVAAGFAKLVQLEKHSILTAIEQTLNDKSKLPRVSPYGNGKAAQEIVNIVAQET